MQILYVTETYPPEINGVALTCERTLHYLREAGHAVRLVRPRQPHESARDGAEDADASPAWLTPGVALPMYRDVRFGLAWPSQLQQRWHDRPPHLVHVATPGPLAWAALIAARRQGIATSADFRTNFHAYSRYYHLGAFEPWVCRALRRFHNLADRTFVPTPSVARELAAQGFERLAVSGRGVDARLFTPARRDGALRAAWGVAGSEPVLLHVGRLAAEKNVGLALRGYEQLRATQPGLRMVVVGDGPARARLAAAHPTVQFLGALRGEALATAYASADVFVFPSLTDTFGNVVLEALASGLAVAAFDTAAAGQHIRQGRSGWLAEPGDEAALVQAMACALDDAAPDSLLRQQAREVACRTQWGLVLQQFERQLCTVVAEAYHGGAHRAALA